MNPGFSFASVVLSYFLVGGGMFAAALVNGQLHIQGEVPAFAVLAAGAFIGGFIAARASRGETVLESAIGAIAVVGTVVGLVAATPIGKLIWAIAEDQTLKLVAVTGMVALVGGLVGAFIGEKLFGEATPSSVPWVVYAGLSTFGASLLAMMFASIIVLGGAEVQDRHTTLDLGHAILIGIAVGCLIAGLAIGASARTRPLLAAFLGGGGGVTGFIALVTRSQPGRLDQETLTGVAVFAVGGALVTLVGTTLGWALFGRRGAAA